MSAARDRPGGALPHLRWRTVLALVPLLALAVHALLPPLATIQAAVLVLAAVLVVIAYRARSFRLPTLAGLPIAVVFQRAPRPGAGDARGDPLRRRGGSAGA